MLCELLQQYHRLTKCWTVGLTLKKQMKIVMLLGTLFAVDN